MAHDPHVKTTNVTPNDPVTRDPHASNPNAYDPALQPHEKKSSSWGKWAAIAAALILGLVILSYVFTGDDAEPVAAVEEDTTVVTTEQPLVDTDETAVEPADNMITTTVPVTTPDVDTAETDEIVVDADNDTVVDADAPVDAEAVVD